MILKSVSKGEFKMATKSFKSRKSDALFVLELISHQCRNSIYKLKCQLSLYFIFSWILQIIISCVISYSFGLIKILILYFLSQVYNFVCSELCWPLQKLKTYKGIYRTLQIIMTMSVKIAFTALYQNINIEILNYVTDYSF